MFLWLYVDHLVMLDAPRDPGALPYSVTVEALQRYLDTTWRFLAKPVVSASLAKPVQPNRWPEHLRALSNLQPDVTWLSREASSTTAQGSAPPTTASTTTLHELLTRVVNSRREAEEASGLSSLSRSASASASSSSASAPPSPELAAIAKALALSLRMQSSARPGERNVRHTAGYSRISRLSLLSVTLSELLLIDAEASWRTQMLLLDRALSDMSPSHFVDVAPDVDVAKEVFLATARAADPTGAMMVYRRADLSPWMESNTTSLPNSLTWRPAVASSLVDSDTIVSLLPPVGAGELAARMALHASRVALTNAGAGVAPAFEEGGEEGGGGCARVVVAVVVVVVFVVLLLTCVQARPYWNPCSRLGEPCRSRTQRRLEGRPVRLPCLAHPRGFAAIGVPHCV
jgi:hypothetical protein